MVPGDEVILPDLYQRRHNWWIVRGAERAWYFAVVQVPGLRAPGWVRDWDGGQ